MPKFVMLSSIEGTISQRSTLIPTLTAVSITILVFNINLSKLAQDAN